MKHVTHQSPEFAPNAPEDDASRVAKPHVPNFAGPCAKLVHRVVIHPKKPLSRGRAANGIDCGDYLPARKHRARGAQKM